MWPDALMWLAGWLARDNNRLHTKLNPVSWPKESMVILVKEKESVGLSCFTRSPS